MGLDSELRSHIEAIDFEKWPKHDATAQWRVTAEYWWCGMDDVFIRSIEEEVEERGYVIRILLFVT